jgi:hypothetical protein
MGHSLFAFVGSPLLLEVEALSVPEKECSIASILALYKVRYYYIRSYHLPLY